MGLSGLFETDLLPVYFQTRSLYKTVIEHTNNRAAEIEAWTNY